MIKRYSTQYTTVDDRLFMSEIYVPPNLEPRDIIKLRGLPNERLHNEIRPTIPRYPKNPLTLLHRLVYLASMKGELPFHFVADTGLLHELIHVMEGSSDADIDVLHAQLLDFEKTVPGTYLWALTKKR